LDILRHGDPILSLYLGSCGEEPQLGWLRQLAPAADDGPKCPGSQREIALDQALADLDRSSGIDLALGFQTAQVLAADEEVLSLKILGLGGSLELKLPLEVVARREHRDFCRRGLFASKSLVAVNLQRGIDRERYWGN